jgi:integrase/recombinase XerD
MKALGRGGERHPWHEAVLRFSAEVLPSQVKPGTAQRYRVSLKQLDRYFGTLAVEDITRKTIAEFVGKRRQDAAVTNATIRRDMTALSALLRACVGAFGWIEENPARLFDRSNVPERRAPRSLPTDEQVAAVERRAGGNLGRLWRALLQSGMREEEAASLEHSQVTPGRGIELLRTKTNSPRMVPLDDKLLKPLGSTIRSTVRSLQTAYVFWHPSKDRDGKPAADRYHNVASRFGRIIAELGFDFTAHDLRHRFAVDYLRNGGNIYHLQKVLGHSSIRTTEIYLAYLTPTEQERAKHGDGSREHKRDHNGSGSEHRAASKHSQREPRK